VEKIDLPEDATIPLNAIAPGVAGLRIVMVNVFVVATGEGWILIDAGLAGSANAIRRWTQTHYNDVPPTAIILTHAHFDHVGALDTLVDSWNAPVYVHREEIPYVRGQQSYPPPDPSVGGGLLARMAALYPRGPIDLGARVRELPADGSIPVLPEWRTIHTPGHTAGHISLFREHDHTLIVGDAFCTTRQESFLAVATQRPELHGPPAYFTTDWDAARDSVRRLAALRPEVAAPGHGQPMAGREMADALDRLASDFDTIARPDQGVYREHTRRK
jgi:glyoxylase-like metal-dependent hydrolase (beta-lactamase superfamily II)